MSVKVSTWVWDATTTSGNDRLILLALADWANDNGWSWYSAEELVAKTRIGRATLFRRLDVLEQAGLVERYRRGKRQTTVYRLAVPWADVSSYPLPDPPAEVKSQIETLVKSRSETSVKSHSEGGEVPPVRPVKSHGRDFQGTISDTSTTLTAIDPFDAFWEAYPRNAGKGQARTAWKAALKKAPAALVMDGLSRHLPVWAVTEERFIPHASTWLNGERWLDHPEGSGPVRRSAWDRAVEVSG